MRVKLLGNTAGYAGLADVNFPVEVEATRYDDTIIDIKGSELINVGANADDWDADFKYGWLLGLGAEVLNED